METSRDRNTAERKTFSTDTCMKNLARAFVEDCRTVMGPDYKQDWVASLDDIPALRSCRFPGRFQSPPYLFKMEAQIENLFKRYRFKADLYTNEELEEISFNKFSQLQQHLGRLDWQPLKHRAFLVVQEARRIIRQVLDGYDPGTLEEFCRFSSKATVGNAARDAYIDHKLADPITGSLEHCRWFKTHLTGNELLSRTIDKCQPSGRPVMVQCESLPLVGVPKSYKSLRLIMPNTLVGSYYTYGLGKVLVKALKEIGLDIRCLQSRHKNLAREQSEKKKLVTADMSAASESFLWSLVCRLLPRKWVRAVRFGRLSQYHLSDGRTFHYCSFMAMGIGFTFPLQTLLFYALVKATCNLLNVNGIVSVYGDDLIYPRRAHEAISTVLTDLGMAFNYDKTFVDVDFRESCGGDFYRKVDVRPFSPEGEHQELSGRRYEAWIYQLLNGLQNHWERESLPKTFSFLESEILRVAPRVKQVPFSYPDSSGLRTAVPIFSPIHSPVLVRMQSELVRISRVADEDCQTRYNNFKQFTGSREYVFEHLTKVSRQRYVCFEQAYIYDWLRAKDNGEDSEVWDDVFEARSFDRWLKHEKWRGNNGPTKWFSEGSPALRTIPLPVQPKNYRGQDGKRLKRCIATSSCKMTLEKIQTTRTGSISDWI